MTDTATWPRMGWASGSSTNPKGMVHATPPKKTPRYVAPAPLAWGICGPPAAETGHPRIVAARPARTASTHPSISDL